MQEDATAALDDAALARRIAAAGARIDFAAESQLYRRLAPRVRLYGLRHLRDRHAAHDLMQQVLLMTLDRAVEPGGRDPCSGAPRRGSRRDHALLPPKA